MITADRLTSLFRPSRIALVGASDKSTFSMLAYRNLVDFGEAFSAGNDLVYNASGKTMWVPKNGFAGLTSRRSIPPKVATEMILTGRRVGADQALAYGLINRVTPAGQALEGARALAAEILDGSPTSVRLSLQAMAETRAIPDVIDAVTSTADVVDELMGSADSAEGMAAFAQKRRPVWRNY